MAEMMIRLECDPHSGRRDIVVTLRPDAELLPFEQERQHRELVQRLIEGGCAIAGASGHILIERDEEPAASVTEPGKAVADESSPQSQAEEA